jgi:hypothetical protein
MAVSLPPSQRKDQGQLSMIRVAVASQRYGSSFGPPQAEGKQEAECVVVTGLFNL